MYEQDTCYHYFGTQLSRFFTLVGLKFSTFPCGPLLKRYLNITRIMLLGYHIQLEAKNIFPLVGGKNIEHLKQNIEALSNKLTPEQIEYLENIVPFDTGFPNTFIVLDTLTQKYYTSNV
mgnify:CR=1 FL=1